MKPRIAEWILAQVLPPDRAASTVGDWMEEVDKRGNIWFWSCVLRTAISRVWSDLTEKPLTMAGIGLLGFARSVLVTIGIVVLEFLWLARYSHSHSTLWLETALYYPLQAWWYFQTGRWVARRMPGREVAGYHGSGLATGRRFPRPLHPRRSSLAAPPPTSSRGMMKH